jgi:ABC-type lipoprotein export system ATPase subunit
MHDKDDKYTMSVQERLVIDNFFSIGHFDWKIKDFNILTGKMASGKSLCLKLLHFIEQILHKNIFFAPISKDNLKRDIFYNNLTKQFNDIFHSNTPCDDFCNTVISYSYSYSDFTFDLTARWNTDSEKLEWNSEYINRNIVEWSGFFGTNNTPDAAKIARTQIHERIKHDFSSYLPIGTEFIPASRAIAAIANPSDIPDSFLENFIRDDKPFVLNFGRTISDKYVNKILHLKKIIVNRSQNNEKTIEIELLNGRKITPLELSSGQQELIYLLLLIKNLPRTQFIYGQTMSIFIEEPSAHLFPQEQKESIEYIVKIFKALQNDNENRVRFFISTHSPYVLNVINNMLKKGHLIKKLDEYDDGPKKDIIKNEVNSLGFPHLMVDEISAYFIQEEVVTMINDSENGAFLYEKIIEDITQYIDDDYKKVRNLLGKIKKLKE